MKKFLLIGLLLWCVQGFSQTITITVNLNSTPNTTTKLVPAPIKYNKKGHFDFTQDDRGISALDQAAYMAGGVANVDGVTYPGKTFTDGANNRGKNIFYTGSIASNAWWSQDTTKDASVNAGLMNWNQVGYVLNKGWSLLDHGAFHGVGLPGATALNFNELQNAAANRNYAFRKLNDIGIQYVMKYGVVPSNDANYHSAWEQLGYLGGISQGSFDGYPAEPLFEYVNEGVTDVSNWLKDNRYKVKPRRFQDVNAQTNVDFYKAKLDVLFSQMATKPSSLSFGIHTMDLSYFRQVMDYIDANDNDNLLVCGLQEFHEYYEVAQQSKVSQKIVGSQLIVTIDQSFLNDDVRWRDMTFLLNSNATMSGITVTGADDYSYNTTTGLINIYKKKTTGFTMPENYTATGFVKNGKIPLQIDDFYQDNNYTYKPDKLIDGDLTQTFEATQYAKDMIYSPFDMVVDLSDYGAIVKKVRIYNSNVSGVTTSVILKRNDNEQEVTIGTLTSSTPNQWVEFVPPSATQFVASRIILRSNKVNGYGNELEVYADYLPYTEQTYATRQTPLKWMLGSNTHWWDFVININSRSTALNQKKIDGWNSLNLNSIRNYGNAKEYSPSPGGKFAFNPVKQGWYEDDFMRALKAANPNLIRWSVLQGQYEHVSTTWDIPDDNYSMTGSVVSYQNNGSWGYVVINVTSSTGAGPTVYTNWWLHPQTGSGTVQTSSNWHDIPSTFPVQKGFNVGGNIPYQVGDIIKIRRRHSSQLNYNFVNNNNTGRSTLATWDTMARLAYVWSARKGTNPNATKSLPWSHVDYDPAGSSWIAPNNDSVGINTSEWFEGMNEPNAYWAGYDDFLNGNHMGAAWSKMYDNNKVYSTTLGSKNADTSIQFSSSGLAVSTVDLNRAADFWSKTNRGNRPKTPVPTQPMDWRSKTFGWRDNPFDILQYHSYSYTGGVNQYAGGVQAGLPPELSHVLGAAKEFVWMRNKYAPWAKVDVGEWGIDTHPESPMNAPRIGNYNAEQVRGAWAVRNMLEFNAIGVDVAQWYRLYQDNNYESGTKKDYYYSTNTADADPGTGIIRVNNSNFYNVTQIYIDNLDKLGADATAFINSFDDRTPDANSTYRGKIHIFKSAANGGPAYITFNVVGVNTAANGYTKLTVEPQQFGSTINNGDPVSIYFGVESNVQFSTMALLRENEDGTISRRLVGNYFRQISEFGDYYFDSRINQEGPRVIKFKKDASNSFVAIWAVEGMTIPANSRPVFTQTSGTYNLALTPNATVKIRRFVDEGDNMSTQVVTVPSNGILAVSYDLKPVFIEVGSSVLGGGSSAAPTANAGPDQSINISSAILNGSGTPGSGETITGYSWQKISGPGTTTILNPNNASVTASGLTSGTYVFRLTVTQSDAQTATDDVTVDVAFISEPTLKGRRNGIKFK
jgi:hypothetical protein